MGLAQGTYTGMSHDEIMLFKKFLGGLQGEAVEIGCLDGYSSVQILEYSCLHLTSIDPIVPDSMEASLIGNEARLKENLAPFGARSTFIKDYSQNVAPTWNTPLDFLFIDGDHTYPAVYRDYVDWTPHLKVGGFMAIHDSRMGRPGGANFHPGPTRLAREMVYDQPQLWEIVGEAFSLTMARKLK